MEKWKKLGIISVVFMLLHSYLRVIFDDTSLPEVESQILVITNVIAVFAFIMAFSSWRGNRPMQMMSWKQGVIFTLVLSGIGYLFIPFLYMNPGLFTDAPGIELLMMSGSFFYATVSLWCAYKFWSDR